MAPGASVAHLGQGAIQKNDFESQEELTLSVWYGPFWLQEPQGPLTPILWALMSFHRLATARMTAPAYNRKQATQVY